MYIYIVLGNVIVVSDLSKCYAGFGYMKFNEFRKK